MSHSNGHHASVNGSAPTGGTGGPKHQHRFRGHLKLLESLVNKGQGLVDEQLTDMLDFARNVYKDKDASERDRLRASELIAKILNVAKDAAIAVDKADRLDRGEATERMEGVTFILNRMEAPKDGGDDRG